VVFALGKSGISGKGRKAMRRRRGTELYHFTYGRFK
jgi:hypothetical protein